MKCPVCELTSRESVFPPNELSCQACGCPLKLGSAGLPVVGQPAEPLPDRQPNPNDFLAALAWIAAHQPEAAIVLKVREMRGHEVLLGGQFGYDVDGDVCLVVHGQLKPKDRSPIVRAPGRRLS